MWHILSLRRLLCAASLYWLLCYSVFLFDKNTIWHLATEDGVIEYLGALFFLITSILFFILFRKSDTGNNFFQVIRTKRNIFYLILGIMFLFAAGEEISWCQRIFDITVPNEYKILNVQKELNIHNLYIFRQDFYGFHFNMVSLFTTFSLVFCFCVPLLDKFVPLFSRHQSQIALPIVPIEIGIFFPLSYLVYNVSKYFILQPELIKPHSEIRESIWAFLFLIIAVHWMLERRASDSSRDIMAPRPFAKKSLGFSSNRVN
jgi:hypothetical protein